VEKTQSYTGQNLLTCDGSLCWKRHQKQIIVLDEHVLFLTKIDNVKY